MISKITRVVAIPAKAKKLIEKGQDLHQDLRHPKHVICTLPPCISVPNH